MSPTLQWFLGVIGSSTAVLLGIAGFIRITKGDAKAEGREQGEIAAKMDAARESKDREQVLLASSIGTLGTTIQTLGANLGEQIGRVAQGVDSQRAEIARLVALPEKVAEIEGRTRALELADARRAATCEERHADG